MDQGKYDLAMVCFDRAIEIDSVFAVAWSNKGRILSQYKRFDEAIECYDKAIQVFRPKNFVSGLDNIWVNKGVAMGDAGKYSESLECFDKAIEINARNVLAWTVKGINLSILRRHDEALLCLDECIRINPTDSTMWDNKGNILNAIGRYEKAIECYDKSLSLNPNNEITLRSKETAINYIKRDKDGLDFQICDLFEHDIKISYPINWTKEVHSLKPPCIAYFHSAHVHIKNKFLNEMIITVEPFAVYRYTLDEVTQYFNK